MTKFLYLGIDLGCLLIPFLFSFYPNQAFYKTWKPFILSNLLVAIPFLIWDEIFSAHNIWGFNPDYLMGIYLFHLPLEEILFFICIPYACTFTYFALGYLYPRPKLKTYNPWILRILGFIYLVFIVCGHDQWYTLITGLLGLSFILFSWIRNIDLSSIVRTYVVILPFFFISNGLLTGFGLTEPIVWYNNHENFGLRILTIPIEDLFYGFLLIALNILGYDYFLKKYNRTI